MITQKQQALIIIALSNVAMVAAKRNGVGVSEESLAAVETFKKALTSVQSVAYILTDEEMVQLAAEATREVMKMPVTDIKIMPDPVSVPLQ